MSEAIARQAAEGIKIDLVLSAKDIDAARRGLLEVRVRPHETMPPGSGMAPIRNDVVMVNVEIAN